MELLAVEIPCIPGSRVHPCRTLRVPLTLLPLLVLKVPALLQLQCAQLQPLTLFQMPQEGLLPRCEWLRAFPVTPLLVLELQPSPGATGLLGLGNTEPANRAGTEQETCKNGAD